MRAFVAVGSNIAPVRHVVAGLRRLHALYPITAMSPFWWTAPLARPDQPPFLNGVVAVDAADLHRLAADLHAIEAAEGRIRTSDAHAARTLDLDLILAGDVVDAELGVPDPELRQRRFLARGVLAIDPDVVVPDGGGPLGDPGGMHLRPEPLVSPAVLANPSNPGPRMALPMPKAPDFELHAAVSGRKVTAKEGRPLVLVFHGPKTTDAPKEVGKAVRAAHPDAADVLVANVVDLRTMGGLWKKVADAGMKATYDKMAGKVDDPVEYVVICPDWDGAVAKAFGVPDPNVEPGVAVLGPDGELKGLHTGSGLGAKAVALLA